MRRLEGIIMRWVLIGCWFSYLLASRLIKWLITKMWRSSRHLMGQGWILNSRRNCLCILGRGLLDGRGLLVCGSVISVAWMGLMWGGVSEFWWVIITLVFWLIFDVLVILVIVLHFIFMECCCWFSHQQLFILSLQ